MKFGSCSIDIVSTRSWRGRLASAGWLPAGRSAVQPMTSPRAIETRMTDLLACTGPPNSSAVFRRGRNVIELWLHAYRLPTARDHVQVLQLRGAPIHEELESLAARPMHEDAVIARAPPVLGQQLLGACQVIGELRDRILNLRAQL